MPHTVLLSEMPGGYDRRYYTSPTAVARNSGYSLDPARDVAVYRLDEAATAQFKKDQPALHKQEEALYRSSQPYLAGWKPKLKAFQHNVIKVVTTWW